MPARAASGADLFVVGGNGVLDHPIADALNVAHILRRAGLSVDHALNAERYRSQATRNQVDSAKKSGARAAIYFESATDLVVLGLAGKLSDAPKQTFPAADVLAGNEAAVATLKQFVDTHIPPRTTT